MRVKVMGNLTWELINESLSEHDNTNSAIINCAARLRSVNGMPFGSGARFTQVYAANN